MIYGSCSEKGRKILGIKKGKNVKEADCVDKENLRNKTMDHDEMTMMITND